NNINSLSLPGSFISDLSPLEGLSYLSELNVAYNCLRDLSPLIKCPKLKNLEIGGNSSLRDFAPLEVLGLESLGLSSYPVRSEKVRVISSFVWQSIPKCKTLTALKIDSCDQNQIKILKQLPLLGEVHLMDFSTKEKTQERKKEEAALRETFPGLTLE